MRVLLIIEQCNPEWASVPLVGYCFYKNISMHVDTTLVTHERNRPALEKAHPDRDIVYIGESDFIRKYYGFAEKLSKIGGNIIWPLYHTLTYPVYGEFNHLVYKKVSASILNGEYDVVHAITPMMPRYPVKAINACKNTPFVIGPVNGGVPFPKGFRQVARKEFSDLNFLRSVGRFIIPGYRETYENADYVLAGSTYTLNMIKELFAIKNEKIELLYENGIHDSFLKSAEDISERNNSTDKKFRLVFVGRLVPYKGADMLIEAMNILGNSVRNNISLTIVGDGSERNALEQQVKTLNLGATVTFTGWVEQHETLRFYSESDVFCFPSVREFGGAVVMEAMAAGLPCIVVNNGGIGEYVTEDTGFRIEPVSKEFVVQELASSIERLFVDRVLLANMSRNAIQRAKGFAWSSKGDAIIGIYQKLLAARSGK